MAVVLMRDRVGVYAAVAVALVFAVLMVSRIRLPNLKGHNLVTFTLFVGMVTFMVVVLQPNWCSVACWNLWNVVILLTARVHTRRLELHSAEGGAE